MLLFPSALGKKVLSKASEAYETLEKFELDILAGMTDDTSAKRWSHLMDLLSMVHLQFNALTSHLRDRDRGHLLDYWAIYPKRVDRDLAMSKKDIHPTHQPSVRPQKWKHKAMPNGFDWIAILFLSCSFALLAWLQSCRMG